ncbi:carboxypeptidase-like regulatory domain-containing protein [Roseisolibacter sp. H3M3-2]|uniref:carboxypeptidase-like regulatory domain-containing protein n=1 Tax=Roseisolibacter sp. H3M3-2 TaxID=3031323 RepID=UPI0023DB3DFB|nr:carboxypeptidase-like regulatory domain-containing protein [Roseisolibacter sp. H3M3-2]MDF1503826.1 carboxypeptidase-like regulatory domain-containing protein [Roseisolibacter sp. H3M3-2]
MRRLGLVLACVVSQALPAGAARAQPAREAVVNGQVVDTLGQPLAAASVALLGTEASATTSASGAFVLTGLAPGRRHLLRIRKIGYAPRTLDVEATGDTVDVLVRLAPLAVQLSEVVVTARERRYATKLRGFAERMRTRAISSQAFVTREDIERRSAFRISDMLRLGSARCARASDFAIFLDGAALAPGTRPDELSLQEIEAMEIYRSVAQIPMEYNVTRMTPRGVYRAECVLLLWTR